MTRLTYSDLNKDAESFQLGDKSIRYASKAALIQLKSKSVREKDQMDARALRQLADDPEAFS